MKPARINWKHVAQERLNKLRATELRLEMLRCELYNNLRRELGIALHARCISKSDTMADSVAADVSLRMTER